jgi:hypothetical protein
MASLEHCGCVGLRAVPQLWNARPTDCALRPDVRRREQPPPFLFATSIEGHAFANRLSVPEYELEPSKAPPSGRF